MGKIRNILSNVFEKDVLHTSGHMRHVQERLKNMEIKLTKTKIASSGENLPITDHPNMWREFFLTVLYLHESNQEETREIEAYIELFKDTFDVSSNLYL
jgi:hypothetical protein